MNYWLNKYRILRRRTLGLFGALVAPEPSYIDIEPTRRCNLRCIFCKHTLPDQDTGQDMSPALFLRILESFPKLRGIKLQGIGEPLLSPHFFKLVEMAKKRGISVSTYTNGTLFSDDNIDRILASGVNEVNISLDHWDPAVVEQIRPGINFHKFVEGVSKFNLKTASSSLTVTGWTVLTNYLEGSVAKHLYFAKTLGFKKVFFQLNLTGWAEAMPENRNLRPGLAVVRETEKASQDHALGMEISCIRPNSFSENQVCPWPFYHCYITVEGSIQPCCILSDHRKYSMGNISKKSFFRIWNSTPYFRLRTEIGSGKPSAACQGCYEIGSAMSTGN